MYSLYVTASGCIIRQPIPPFCTSWVCKNTRVWTNRKRRTVQQYGRVRLYGPSSLFTKVLNSYLPECMLRRFGEKARPKPSNLAHQKEGVLPSTLFLAAAKPRADWCFLHKQKNDRGGGVAGTTETQQRVPVKQRHRAGAPAPNRMWARPPPPVIGLRGPACKVQRK